MKRRSFFAGLAVLALSPLAFLPKVKRQRMRFMSVYKHAIMPMNHDYKYMILFKREKP